MKKLVYLLFMLPIFIGCNKDPKFNDPIPDHDSFTLVSQHLNETRVINVWIPKELKTNNTALPVIYMPDGGIEEDFPHIANTIAALVENKSIPPIILVGIENTDRRRDLSGASQEKEDAKYCPLTDGAKNFRAFITSELFPEINKRYQTTNKKGIIGESLAGLFIMETFLLNPEIFDFYIAMDPSLWWNNHSLEKNTPNYLKNFTSKKTKLWFAGSGAEDVSVFTNNIEKYLLSNAPENVIWKYCNEPNEKHSTIFRATKEKALVWTLNAK
ncbi:alpha/beta hydrolase [Algibacter sp. L1A34]|uniref:alpha/beta hydrolase n=1 Tax=Algibacter sp. L1A34 TaxID=2686365 RepID=UPI00131B9201|nr:alpha/beta hydrolase-fold protein [Algibacter sp. L1A34]